MQKQSVYTFVTVWGHCRSIKTCGFSTSHDSAALW